MNYPEIGMLIEGIRCKFRLNNGECPKSYTLCSFLAWMWDVLSLPFTIFQNTGWADNRCKAGQNGIWTDQTSKATATEKWWKKKNRFNCIIFFNNFIFYL